MYSQREGRPAAKTHIGDQFGHQLPSNEKNIYQPWKEKDKQNKLNKSLSTSFQDIYLLD